MIPAEEAIELEVEVPQMFCLKVGRHRGRTEPTDTLPFTHHLLGAPGNGVQSARRTKDIPGSWKWEVIPALLDVLELHHQNSAGLQSGHERNTLLPSVGCSRAGQTSAARNFPR